MSTPMWHYIWQNQQTGPIPEAELRRYLTEGRLPPDTLVWTAGMAQWAPASQQALLQGVSAAAPSNLSPSEVAFFHAERFARPGSMLDSMELIHLPHKVKATELGLAMMALAFLAAEQAGAITLTLREQKGLFGLKSTKVVDVGRGPKQVTWPAQSLEAGIIHFLQQGKTAVGDIVYELLLEEHTVPAQLPYQVIRKHLAAKGLVLTHEKKGLLGSVTYTYSLTPTAMQVAATQDPTPWLQLLEQTQRSRGELWGALGAGIQHGFSRRQERDRTSDGPDLDYD